MHPALSRLESVLSLCFLHLHSTFCGLCSLFSFCSLLHCLPYILCLLARRRQSPTHGCTLLWPLVYIAPSLWLSICPGPLFPLSFPALAVLVRSGPLIPCPFTLYPFPSRSYPPPCLFLFPALLPALVLPSSGGNIFIAASSSYLCPRHHPRIVNARVCTANPAPLHSLSQHWLLFFFLFSNFLFLFFFFFFPSHSSSLPSLSSLPFIYILFFTFIAASSHLIYATLSNLSLHSHLQTTYHLQSPLPRAHSSRAPFLLWYATRDVCCL